MYKKMTQQQLWEKLKETRTISLEMWNAFGMPIEIWVRMQKMSEGHKQDIIDSLIAARDLKYCRSCKDSPCHCDAS